MKKIKTLSMAALLMLATAVSIAADVPVKKSKSGICHVQGSQYYSRTKNFTPYKTLEECLKSGGRKPR
jgi:hypothetical protein